MQTMTVTQPSWGGGGYKLPVIGKNFEVTVHGQQLQTLTKLCGFTMKTLISSTLCKLLQFISLTSGNSYYYQELVEKDVVSDELHYHTLYNNISF
jgi:hypothetical protein